VKRARGFWLLLIPIGVGAIAPSYLRVYRAAGPSDAPTILAGDRILVSRFAYDVRLPYTDVVVVSHGQPRRGEVVLFRPPGGDIVVFKRVIGCPGDTVLEGDGRFEINGVPLRYARVDRTEFEPVARRNALGSLIEEETGNGPPHLITRTPDLRSRTPPVAVRVPEGHYYMVGDNRDNSRDSRDYGAVRRTSILGRVVRVYRSVP